MDQMRGMFTAEQFCLASLPRECQHWFSGLSGILYVLPMFSTSRRMTICGKSMWVAQAVLSCLADYVYVGLAHPVHGIDRHFATMNCLVILAIGAKSRLSYYLLASVVPLGVHLAARIAQQEKNWHLWVFLHGWWHITSTVLIYWFYNEEQVVHEESQKVHEESQKRGKLRKKEGSSQKDRRHTPRAMSTRSRSRGGGRKVVGPRTSPPPTNARTLSRKRRSVK